MSMSSEDIYVVTRLYDDTLQYLTKKDIWSKLPAEAKKFRTAEPALEHLSLTTEVWRMSPDPEKPGMYTIVGTYTQTEVPAPKPKRGKKK